MYDVTFSVISKKRFSQWNDLMKTYYKKHEEICKVEDVPVDPFLDRHDVRHYATGSSYDGAVNFLGMNGYGEYTYPNGVVYRGDFHDGQFHGEGELLYNNGPEADTVIHGQWINGILKEQKIVFNGKLEYDSNDWMYCLLPDRRYAVEFETDLYTAGQSLITPDNPPRTIPSGYCDTGDGFYNPKTKMVYAYDNRAKVLRGPSVHESKWIVNNCRKEPVGVLGPRQDLYEKWIEPVLEPPPLPEPVKGYHTSSSINASLAYQASMDESVHPLFYDSNLLS